MRICLNASDTAAGISRGESTSPPPLGHGPHHVQLAKDFMDGPEVLTDVAPRDLAGDEKDGRGAGVRRGQAAGGVVHARAWDDKGHARFPRSAGIAVGHVRRALFMAGRDQTDARLVPKRDDDPGHMYARDPEDNFNAFVHERLD